MPHIQVISNSVLTEFTVCDHIIKKKKWNSGSSGRSQMGMRENKVLMPGQQCTLYQICDEMTQAFFRFCFLNTEM